MTKWHEFLVEHAKFPFPRPDELQPADSTDISECEVNFIKKEWKAKHAVRDDFLIQKLCHTLQTILGDTDIAEDSRNVLLPFFAPQLHIRRGRVAALWSENPNEAHTKMLLVKGFYDAADNFLEEYGPYEFRIKPEIIVEGAQSKVDYVVLVDNQSRVLCEVKSPSVMKKLGELLPRHGVELKWLRGQPLTLKVIQRIALYLGLRKMEWLFLTCHNYWIVFRLVRDDDHPFIAYSPMISIEDSSEPFRAFLGALLSFIKGVSVESSVFSTETQLDFIEEEGDEGPASENDIDDGSGANSRKENQITPPMTRARARAGHQDVESELMVTSSSSNSPKSSQRWVHFHTLSNNSLSLPQCAESGKRRLWMTRLVGFGSTGSVWQCHFDNSDDSFAIKIVEVLRRSDLGARQRLRNEFLIYLTLEDAYKSGQLHDRIAPRCYGGFEGNGIDALILDFHDNILATWDELSASERNQIYKLVQDLHSTGIVHDDLEPRNIVRTHGGFRLIDFSQSTTHICPESSVDRTHQNQKCSELQMLRQLLLRKRQPLHSVNKDFKLGISKSENVGGQKMSLVDEDHAVSTGMVGSTR